VRACLSRQRTHIPDLGFAWCDVVWASSTVVTVIVHIQIEVGCGCSSDVLYGRNDEELVAGVHLCDRLARVGVLLEPNAINC